MDAAGIVSRRADAAGIRVPDRHRGAFDSGDSGLHVHRRVRRGHAGTWLGAVLAGVAGVGNLGADLLRRLAGRAAFGHPGHARDGSGAAHLVRRAGLFRAGRHACRAVLDFGVNADAAGSAGRAVQWPPAPVARYHPGNRGYQQLGPQPRRAAGANVLTATPWVNRLTVSLRGAMLALASLRRLTTFRDPALA